MADKQYLEQLSRKLADDGRLIEAGWIAFRLVAVPPDASATQLDAMRIAYMAGAQHLFSSIMTILEPGQMETEADVSRLDLIDKELDKFAQELALRTTRARGGA
jgi:hypothetical protein